MVCLSRILQCTVRDGGVHISALDGVLWGMGEVHCGMCETDLLKIICARKHNISVQYEMAARMRFTYECEVICLILLILCFILRVFMNFTTVIDEWRFSSCE